MNKIQKTEAIKILKDKFAQYQHFYITNTESLSVAQINHLRRNCFDKKVEMLVAKNTLVKKALEELDAEKYNGIIPALHGVTSVMFSNTPKEPALILSSFRDTHANANGRPMLKAAFVLNENYLGDIKLAELKALKTKEELVGDIIALLQSPLRNIISGLQNKKEQAHENKAEEVTTA